jgi:beta-lactamase class A
MTSLALFFIVLAPATSNACGLESTLDTLAKSALPGVLGADLEVLETRERATTAGSAHFPMQSVYKLPIAMAMLREVEAGSRALGEEVAIEPSDLVPAGAYSPIRDAHPKGVRMSLEEIVRFAIVESDGTASDVLLRLLGGPEKVNTYLSGIGVHDIVVATSEAEMSRDWKVQYRNWATPEGAVLALRTLYEGAGLSPRNRALLFEMLAASKPGAARLKGLLPPGTPVAHKTGTSGTLSGVTAATNDIGIITLPSGHHLAIAVFLRDSPESDADRDKAIAEVAKAGFACWH